MGRKLGLDVQAASCTLAVFLQIGKRLKELVAALWDYAPGDLGWVAA